jgi:uncharacterized protein YmfQ (DUF2313 family)
MGVTVANYHQLILALLPQGKLWNVEPGSTLDQLILACAEELARLDQRSTELINEVFPDTTDELMADWERVAGLPDLCSGPLATYQQRRAALVSKLISTGGSTPQYFIEVAQALGFNATIQEFSPFVAGSAAGDPLNSELWQFVWKMTSTLSGVFDFRAGVSRAGEPLKSWGNAILECAISAIKPAHTTCLFAYE